MLTIDNIRKEFEKYTEKIQEQVMGKN